MLEQTGEQARDEGIERVTRSNKAWAELAYAEWRNGLPRNEPITGETVRIGLTNKGIVPNHHGAWGAFIMKLVKAGDLIPTGEWEMMKLRKSHARKTPLYNVAQETATP